VLANFYSCTVVGPEAAVVEVEVDRANGLPSFVEVGAQPQRRGPVYGTVGEDGWQAEPGADGLPDAVTFTAKICRTVGYQPEYGGWSH
jgi:hypothetical protein